MANNKKTRLADSSPRDELEILIREATASVEEDLALEDAGWINLSAQPFEVITSSERIDNVKLSRLYALKDPMGKQAIRLWTDYTFGSGMTWQSENEKCTKALEEFWDAPENRSILSARGQRKSSDKLLIDGEVFFALFLGPNGSAKIRRIDPLEITEIITDSDDKESLMYYRRQWTDAQSKPHEDIYRSTTNPQNKATPDMYGKSVQKTEDALVYHLTYCTTSQRGNPLLLPALKWMKYLTRQLSSYIAVDIAQGTFVLRSKVKGGQVAVDAIKATTNAQRIPAGSHLVENMGVDTSSLTMDKRAKNAYDGARLTKLQVCAAVGIPEQYFGDISIGNLATAKTVELPMMKQFESYQKVWADAYQDIDEVVLAHNNVAPEGWYIDRDFPPIAPADMAQAALSLKEILMVMPQFADAPEVQQAALMALGINDPAEVIEQLTKEAGGNPDVALARVLKQFREVLKVQGNGR